MGKKSLNIYKKIQHAKLNYIEKQYLEYPHIIILNNRACYKVKSYFWSDTKVKNSNIRTETEIYMRDVKHELISTLYVAGRIVSSPKCSDVLTSETVTGLPDMANAFFRCN